jgi:hypothetical protein
MKKESEFLSQLDLELCPDCDGIWTLRNPLGYYSAMLDCEIWVPPTFPAIRFYTDLASVPRIPIIYEAWGNKAHREAVLHDYLFCINSRPVVSFMKANRVMLEAMEVRMKPIYIRYPIFWGVCAGGYPSYHKRNVEDDLTAKQIRQHQEETIEKQLEQ